MKLLDECYSWVIAALTGILKVDTKSVLVAVKLNVVHSPSVLLRPGKAYLQKFLYSLVILSQTLLD